MSPPPPEVVARDLLGEAGRWRLLAVLFARPRPGWLAEVSALAAELGDDGLSRAADAAAEASEGSYLAVLGPGGSVSPREVSYAGMSDPGRTLAGLETLYRALGFHATSEDPVDHIATQLDFAGFATMKLAFAATRGDADSLVTIRAVRETFFDDHLGPFAARFAERLSGCGLACLERAAARLAAMPEVARRSARQERAREAGALPVVGQDPFESGESCGACAPDGE